MNLRERVRTLIERTGPVPGSVEASLRHRFQFLVDEQGFELTRSDALRDGAVAAYKNVPAGRAVMVFARAKKGAWAGIGPLDPAGRMTTLDREALEQGQWRRLGEVPLGVGVRTLDEAIERLADSLRSGRA
jgi:hypothetical protein